MRSLFQFFVRFSSFFIFLILEVIAFVFIIRDHAYQNAGFVNSANEVVGRTYESINNTKEYLRLKEINDSLRDENARLRGAQFASYRDETYTVDANCNNDFSQIYTFISAKVINKTTDKANNYITINRGSKQGIKKDMGVITDHGIVGIVTTVSEHFAVVMTVLHKDSKISVKIGQSNYTGSLVWEGKNPRECDVVNVPNHVKVAVGDTVYSTGYSSIFPENIMVGRIKKATVPSGSNFYEITVTLSTNFESLPYVYVVNYLYKKEQAEVEQNND
jgi:rod shape-determining protein MreC